MSERLIIRTTGSTGPSGGAGTTALDDLTDVTITAAASGDILRHNGTAWVDTPGTTHFEVAGAAAAAQAASQPLDSDLTAIAALTTTAYGRAFLTLANQAATMALLSAASETASGIVELATNAETATGTDTARAITPANLASVLSSYLTTAAAASGYQPLDSDLTAIAALTTTAYGRAFLSLSNLAALQAVLGTGTPSASTYLRGDGTWSTPASGGAVATDVIFDAKGDLPVGTGADTASKLTAGANGRVLTADSAESTGLKWSHSRLPMVNNSGSHRYVAPGVIQVGAFGTTQAMVSGTTYYYGPYESTNDIGTDALQFKVNALTGTVKVRIAFISIDPADWQPLATVYAVAEQTYTTTGEKIVTFGGTQTLPAGPYFVGIKVDGNMTLEVFRGHSVAGFRGFEEGYQQVSLYTVTEAYGAFASPAADWTSITAGAGIVGHPYPVLWRIA